MNRRWKTKEEMTPLDWAEVRAARARSLNAATEKLNVGLSELIRSGRWAEYLRFCARFHRYSFINTALILMQFPEATQVASLQTWNRLGRYVKKGERGMDIFVPILVEAPLPGSKEHRPAPSGERGEASEALKEEPEPAAPENARSLVGFKLGKVFDVSQTEGAPLPRPLVSLLNGDDHGLVQALTACARTSGIAVSELPGLRGAYGVCTHGSDGRAVAIGVLAELPPAQKAKTLAHELAHARLHSAPEYRSHADNSLQELEAESVAYLVLHHFGIDSGAYSFGYLADWAGGEPALALIKARGQRIYRTAFEILTWIEEHFQPSDEGAGRLLGRPQEIEVEV